MERSSSAFRYLAEAVSQVVFVMRETGTGTYTSEHDCLSFSELISAEYPTDSLSVEFSGETLQQFFFLHLF